MEFPLFKIGKYESIEYTPLGKVYITTVRDKYVLDDTSLKGDTLGKRRLIAKIKKYKLYKFRGKVDTLRQLSKHPGGTVFIDNLGKVIKYTKSRKRFEVVSCKITKKVEKDEGMLLYIKGIPTPHYIPYRYIADNINYVSVMLTPSGPFIYDYTIEKHKPYKRSL